MTAAANPDCAQGKHRACSGSAWDWDIDDLVPCPCDCHAQPPTPPEEPS